jgi:hypothetical protein
VDDSSSTYVRVLAATPVKHQQPATIRSQPWTGRIPESGAGIVSRRRVDHPVRENEAVNVSINDRIMTDFYKALGLDEPVDTCRDPMARTFE